VRLSVGLCAPISNLGIDADRLLALVALIRKDILVTFDAIWVVVSKNISLAG
jgi:hypothetical protein